MYNSCADVLFLKKGNSGALPKWWISFGAPLLPLNLYIGLFWLHCDCANAADAAVIIVEIKNMRFIVVVGLVINIFKATVKNIVPLEREHFVKFLTPP